MKKFLTVLLVIAVMFTFSFGSAFAAPPALKDQVTPEQVEKEIREAAANAIDAVKKERDAALFGIFGVKSEAKIENVVVQKTTVEKVYDDVFYTPAVKEINALLDQKLQAAHAAMNPTNGKTFSGYFTTGSADVVDTVNGIDYVYPAYDKDFSQAKIDADLDADGTIEDSVSPAEKDIMINGFKQANFEALFKNNPSALGTYAGKIARSSFDVTKDAALAAIRATDLSVYSKEYKGAAKTNYQIATELVEKAVKEITAITINSNDTWSQVVTAVGKIAAIHTPAENQQPATGSLYDGTGNYAPGLDKLEKIADEPTNEAKLAWAKSQVLAELTSQINTRLNNINKTQDAIILDETLKGAKGNAAAIAKAKDAKEIAAEQAAAATEVVTYLVNNCKELTDLIKENKTFSQSEVLVTGHTSLQPGTTAKWTYDVATTGDLKAPSTKANYTAKDMVDISKHVKELKEEAEILKASVMLDGAEYVAIEKALENAIDDTYVKGLTTNRVSDMDDQQALWARQDELTGANSKQDVKVNDRKYNTVASWTTALDNTSGTKNNGTYEQKFYDELRAVKKETRSAVNAAKTIAEAEAAFVAGYEKFDAILSLADRSAASVTKEYADLLDKYTKELDAYMTYKTTYLTKTDTAKNYTWVSATMLTKLQKTLADAYTTDEMTANFEAAKKEIDNLQTAAALETAKAEIVKRVQALPKTITIADKETVGALKKDLDAHNKYCELIGNTTAKVIIAYATATDNAYTKVKQLEKDEIEADIKAIGTVTLEKEAAIKALNDKLDAYVTYYAGEDAEDTTIKNLKDIRYNNISVADLNADLEKEKVKAYRVMVGKLPADGSDLAGIKAARAAYDGLSRTSKIAQYRQSEYDKLLDLEKIANKAVTSLKLNASSKAKKGSITVTWTVKGNAAVAEGYQVWKSTKANKGYKKAFTTKKTSYKNTKGLKKGTRYYYKVRAYATALDGTVLYSDWSNKAYRKAK